MLLRNYFIISLILLGISMTVKAQNRKMLTLDEAIQLSLQNSKELKLGLEKIKEANAVLKQANENNKKLIKEDI